MTKKHEDPDPEVPDAVDWNALRQTAAFLQRANLYDFVGMINNPWKNIYFNFIAGTARGVGFVVGFTIIGGIMLFGLKRAFAHAGGLPIFGDDLKQVIGYILDAVREAQGKGGH